MQPLFTQLNETSSITLIHVSIANPVVGLSLQFSAPVDYVIGEAAVIPTLGATASLFFQPNDPMLRVPSEQYSTSALVIPAVALKPGVYSQDFYAVIMTSNPASMTVTASVIPTQTVAYDPVSRSAIIQVAPSPSAQIFHIPFTEDLQVVFTQLNWSSGECLTGNVTQV